MKKLSMTLSSPDVALAEGKGAVTASVNNASAAAERVVLGAFPTGESAPGVPNVSTWASVDEPLRTISPGATVQYEVTFNTAGASPGTYPVKLIPYSADEAPEDYAELGSVVQLVVSQPAVEVPPKKFPWWIVIVAAVLLVAGGVAAFLLTRQEEPAPVPIVLELTSFSPSTGPMGTETTVQLIGRFVEPTVVTVGETQIAATRVSDTEYTVVLPSTLVAGQVPLLVESAGERVGVAIFEYTAPQPSPSGPGKGGTICERFPSICDDFVIPEKRQFDPGQVIDPLQPPEIDPFDLNLPGFNR